MSNPFKFLQSINADKNDLLKENPDNIKDYNSFLINRGLSYFHDTVLHANEMNINWQLPADMQYGYLLNSINKRKRYSKWYKKTSSEDLELVKLVYKVSNEKAIEMLKLLTKDQLIFLKKQQETGGIK